MRALRLFAGIALTHLRHRRRQTLVSVLGVAIGVGFSIAMAALMQGFQQFFIDRIINAAPHVVMHDDYRDPPAQPVSRIYSDATIEISGLKPLRERRGIKDARAAIASLETRPGIAVAPVLSGPLILSYGAKDLSISVVGIDPEREVRVTTLANDMVEGSLSLLRTNPNGIVVGTGLMKKLGLRMGQQVTAASPTGASISMKVVGRFETGLAAVDQGTAYVLLKKAQVLQDQPDAINQIRIRLADVAVASDTAKSIERQFGYRTESWEETNSNILSIFVVQNSVMFSTVGAILLVAAFGIYNIISTVVYEKSRDIAILKSMGFRERDIRLIFVLEGALVGLIGALAGWALGYLLTQLLGVIPLPGQGGMIRRPTSGFILYESFTHYLVSGGFALVAAVAAGFIPARKAARLDPVEIIRGGV